MGTAGTKDFEGEKRSYPKAGSPNLGSMKTHDPWGPEF